MPDIKEWNVENEAFWERSGKPVAFRNLRISALSLMCGFSVWLCWSVISVQMLNVGFPFSTAELFNLIAIAGLSGATLRIPSSFLVRFAGGRNTICVTTTLLALPAVGTGLALQSMQTPLWVFQLLAMLSGIGGGNFVSSMSNISAFFPKKDQSFALGINAGLGVLGVSLMQVLLPLIMMTALFGGAPMLLENASGIFFDKIMPGTLVYMHNAGYVWLVCLVPLVVAIWLRMNNIRTSTGSLRTPSPLRAFFVITAMLAIGFVTTLLGMYLLSFSLPDELVLLIVIATTVLLLQALPGRVRARINCDFQIWNSKHTWIMSVLYTMTFGSFIGFSAAFALCIKVVFGYSHVPGVDGQLTHNTVNVFGPSALMYAWMGPFIAVLTRSVGVWVAMNMGGARVTQGAALVMLVSTLFAAHYLGLAYRSAAPEELFIPFFIAFLIFFGAAGIGNGSSLHTMSVVFDKEEVGAAISWASTIAAFGAFYIPRVMAEQIEVATPEYAFYGFALFYAICMLLNGWFYLRRDDEFYNA